MSIYIETNYPSTSTGSTNVDCIGLVSSSGNSTTIKQENDAANAAASARERRRKIIIGVCVTLGCLILLGLGAATFYWMRRRQRLKQEEEASLAPHQFVEVPKSPDQVLSVGSDLTSSPRAEKAALAAVGASQAISSPSQGSTAPGLSSSNSDTVANTSNILTVSNADSQSTSGFATFPTASIRRNPKAAEAGYTLQSHEPGSPASATSAVGRAEEEVVFQHRDGGGAVRELPPPYLDRSGPGASSSS